MATTSSVRNRAPSTANWAEMPWVGSMNWGRKAVKMRMAFGLLVTSLILGL